MSSATKLRRHVRAQYKSLTAWHDPAPKCDECQDRKVVPEYDNAGGFVAKPCPLCVDPRCHHCDVVIPLGYTLCASCGDAAGP